MTKNKLNPPAKVGFIGLGNMGYPMAAHLANAGYQLTVADLNPQAVDKFCLETGSTSQDDLQSLGKACDVVITMLPDGNAVRKVLVGEQSVSAGLAAGNIIIDMSSSSPVGTRELAGELATLDISLVDAPVSGGVVKAVAANLAIMAGGEADAVAAVQPVLATMGKVFATGQSGTAHAMKALNNYLSAATLAMTSEAVLAGKEFGLDPKVMIEILNNSTGRNNSAEHKFPTFIFPETFNSGFFLGLMAKDLRFARSLAESMQTPHHLLNDISRLYDEAEQKLGFKADNTEIYRFLEQQAESQENS